MCETVTWIPVEERLPDADITVMVHGPDMDPPMWLGWYDDERESWFEVSASTIEGVTHWAELPNGPPGR
jgi:hypothetical protein